MSRPMSDSPLDASDHGPQRPAAFGNPSPVGSPTPQPRPDSNNGRRPGRVRRFEGLRGRATRGAVIARYVAAMGAIIVCAGINRAGLEHIPMASSGWTLLIGAVAVQLTIAVAGTFAFPARRDEIIEQARHYVFGLTLFPTTGLAAFIWVLRPLSTAGPGTEGALSTVNAALPYLYFLPLIIVTLVFAKAISGIAGFNRVSMDDEEMMLTLTRQDGLQR